MAPAPPTYAWGEGNKLFPYVPCLLARGRHVYFANDRGFAGCFEAKTGKQVWYERLEGATFNSSPVMIDGLVYAPSVEGDVFVFAAEPTFKLLAKNAMGERFRALPRRRRWPALFAWAVAFVLHREEVRQRYADEPRGLAPRHSDPCKCVKFPRGALCLRAKPGGSSTNLQLR